MTIDPDRLDALLEHEPYLDDDGFTARVMDALPPRRGPRTVLLWGSSAAAAVTAVLVLPGVVEVGLAALASANLSAALATALLVGGAAAGAAALVGLVVALEV